MTENKPVVWLYDFYSASMGVWATGAMSTVNPARFTGTKTRNVRPLYEHPPAPQPDQDPAVEAARRKALRAIFAALDWHKGCGDGASIFLSAAILRDLVGQLRQGGPPVPFYDEGPEPLKTSATMTEQRVNTADLREPAPARLSVDLLASVIRNRAGLCLWAFDTGTCMSIATAVHEAVYGKDA